MRNAYAEGVVVAGHGVASGRSGDPRFPGGTIASQLPVFRARGVDVAGLLGAEPFAGTINLDVAPCRPQVMRPEILLPGIAWSPAAPAENFWLFRATLTHAGKTHTALVYMPDPATKPEHFQADTVVEIIAAPLKACPPGTRLTIAVDPRYLFFG